MSSTGPTVTALLLVVIANLAPWAAGRLMRQRLGYPLDCGACWPDGVPVLGSHKTWRGLLAAVLGCGLTALMLGLGFPIGAGFGALAMLGDASTSAIKRRLGLPPGAVIHGIDQLPEALLPLWIYSAELGLGASDVVLVALVFGVLAVLGSLLTSRR